MIPSLRYLALSNIPSLSHIEQVPHSALAGDLLPSVPSSVKKKRITLLLYIITTSKYPPINANCCAEIHEREMSIPAVSLHLSLSFIIRLYFFSKSKCHPDGVTPPNSKRVYQPHFLSEVIPRLGPKLYS